MQAEEFNARYPVGSYFTYRPYKYICSGVVVKTKGVARDIGLSTFVEISLDPYFTNIELRRPA